MAIIRKYGVLAAAVLLGFSSSAVGGGYARATEFAALADYYTEEADVEIEDAAAGVEWDPHSFIALASHRSLVGARIKVTYPEGLGEAREVVVRIIGQCPDEELTGEFECVLMLSFAAADRIGITRVPSAGRRQPGSGVLKDESTPVPVWVRVMSPIGG